MGDYWDTYWQHRGADPDGGRTTPERRRRLLRVLADGVEPGESVLDLGCGSGLFSRTIAEGGYRVTGVDISRRALQRAREAVGQAEFRELREDGGIPVQDGEFALVWSSEVLEHVFDVTGHLREVHRVLKPNGLFVLTTPFHGRIKNVLIAATMFDRHFDVEGEHIRFFAKAALRRCLTGAGFEPVLWSGVGRFWPVYRSWFVVARKTKG